MPKRPESHIRGDMAVNRVMGVCLSAGWACERVAADYGEDICAQTVCRETVDPYRIFIQVKGTKSLSRYTKGGRLYVTVSKEHALRWIRSPDPVVLVLWDISKDIGYYSVVAYQLSEYDLFFSRAKTVRLLLDQQQPFDQRVASRLAWELRISFFSRLLSDAKNQDNTVEECAPKGVKEIHMSRARLIAIDFLKVAGILQSDDASHMTVNRRFIIGYMNFEKALLAKSDAAKLSKSDKKRIITQSIMGSFLGSVCDCESTLGVPVNLLYECTSSLLVVLRALGIPLPDYLFEDDVAKKTNASSPSVPNRPRGKRSHKPAV